MTRKVAGWLRSGTRLISLDDIGSVLVSHGKGVDVEEWQLVILGSSENPDDRRTVASAIYGDEAICREDAETIERARRSPMFGGTVTLRGRAV